MTLQIGSECDICGGTIARIHRVREMMLGLRESFTYGECADCGSLQLLDAPADLSRYYPPDYYSMVSRTQGSWVVRLAKRVRAEAAARGHDRVARLVGLGYAPPLWATWLRVAGVSRADAICDIGCGSGDWLVNLKHQGFRNITGADAFIPRSTEKHGVVIHKATPAELVGQYDFIMLNHSFEHMAGPLGTLRALAALLQPAGSLMLRVPIAGCFAWREYGSDWVSIDAPRHLYVPSERGLTDLAERCGFEIYHVQYDSTADQFWRSEQYRDDIPLFDRRSYQLDRASPRFTREQMRTWSARAEALNTERDGDTAAFFLRLA